MKSRKQLFPDDLDDLGAIKSDDKNGQVKYSIPVSDPDRIGDSGGARNRFEKLASDLVVGVDHLQILQ